MNKNKILVVMTSFLLAVVMFFQSSLDVEAAFSGYSVQTPYLHVLDSEVVYRSNCYFNYDMNMLSDQKYKVRLVFNYSYTPSASLNVLNSWNAFYIEYGGVLYHPYVCDKQGGTVAFDFVCSGINSSEFSLVIDSHFSWNKAANDMVDDASAYTCRFIYEISPAVEFTVSAVVSSDDNIVSAIQQGSSSISSSVQQGTNEIVGAIEKNTDDISYAVSSGTDNVVSAVDRGSSILSRINQTLQGMTSGYDSSVGDGASEGLNGSLGSYEDAEGAVTDTAIGNLGNYTIDSSGISGYAAALLTTFPLVSAMMQSIFVSSGNLAIVITAGFTLTIVCMIIGISKFFVR